MLSPEDRITDAWINDLQPLLTKLRATASIRRPSPAAGGPFTITVSFPTGQIYFYDGGTESQALANAARFLRSFLRERIEQQWPPNRETPASEPNETQPPNPNDAILALIANHSGGFRSTRSETEQFTTDEPIDDLMTNDLVEEQCRELRERNAHLEQQLTRAIRQRDEARDRITATEAEAQRWRISYEQASEDRDRIDQDRRNLLAESQVLAHELLRATSDIDVFLRMLADRDRRPTGDHEAGRRPIEKQLIAGASPDQPVHPTWPPCPKCGSSKKPILTFQFAPAAQYGRFDIVHHHDCHDRSEHLHLRCSRCGYGSGRAGGQWTAPCLDAPNPSSEEAPA